MGRSRGKGQKQPVINTQVEDNVVKEKTLPNRKRGRPSKSVKDELVEEEQATEMIEKTRQNGEKKQTSMLNKDVTIHIENGDGSEIGNAFSAKSVGFRQIGSRRKNKPRRAALVGPECI